MTFAQTLQTVVLPQAVRTVIPPLASILIALYALFLGIAAGYILIVFAISGAAHRLERRLVVIR